MTMKRRSKGSLRLAALAFAVASVFSSATWAQSNTTMSPGESADAPSAGMMAFDLLLVRPASLAATVIGTGLFIIDLPLSIFQKDAPAQPFHQLVVAPARYTFTRPLGALN